MKVVQREHATCESNTHIKMHKEWGINYLKSRQKRALYIWHRVLILSPVLQVIDLDRYVTSSSIKLPTAVYSYVATPSRGRRTVAYTDQ